MKINMKRKITLEDITIRNILKPGDIGFLIYLHGSLYKKEYNYGIEFETYVAKGLCKFYDNYNPKKDRIWICEHRGQIMGSLLLEQRNEVAQLRYFLIKPGYRGIGLGSKLMNLYLKFLKQSGYKKSYLWTTSELTSAAFLYCKTGFKIIEKKESFQNFGKKVTEQKYELIL
jgi:N-acetylglutamate synthase-like GNAT family acetyltransferase